MFLPLVTQSLPRPTGSIAKTTTVAAVRSGGTAISNVAEDVAGNIGRTFKTAITGIKLDFEDLGGSLRATLKGIGKSLLSDLKNTALDFLKTQGTSLLASFLPGGGGGGGIVGQVSGFLGSLFGRASGGRVQPGVPTLVGERGTELLVADRPGTIINHGDMQHMTHSSTSSNALSQNFNVTADIRDSVKAQIYEHLPVIEGRIFDRLSRARAGIR